MCLCGHGLNVATLTRKWDRVQHVNNQHVLPHQCSDRDPFPPCQACQVYQAFHLYLIGSKFSMVVLRSFLRQNEEKRSWGHESKERYTS